jgi:hypothetical protein
METNQGYVYLAKFTLALFEYIKSGEQINNEKNGDNNNKIAL